MSPRTKTQLKQLKDKRRHQIMDAALELFAKEGYHSTSISDIAARAKIAKGLIYTYFSSKEDLIYQIYKSGLDEILSIFDPNKDGILTREEMKFFINELFKKITENIEYWKFYFSLSLQPQVQSQIENLYDFADPFLVELEEYFKMMKFKHPKEEAFLLHCTMDGIISNYTANPKTFPLDKVKKLLLLKYT